MQSPAYMITQDYECDYSVDYGRKAPERKRRSHRPQYSRGGARPVLVNGIHRRRFKRWTW
jgi:hypothetical protein